MAEPSPTERTPFFEFQARNRRATWRLTLAYALVVGGCGFLSAVGFVANVFLALFALVFVPAVTCLGLGALALPSPVTAGLASPIWDMGMAPHGDAPRAQAASQAARANGRGARGAGAPYRPKSRWPIRSSRTWVTAEKSSELEPRRAPSA